MKKLISTALFFIWACNASALHADDHSDVEGVLNAFHQAASDANWDTYFSLMTDDSIFLGTDAGERWNKPTFQSYAKRTKGWVYHMRERHVSFAPDGNTAWFDEILHQKKYGTSRGTGVLIRTNTGWKISQYHLTFPIPNDLTDKFTKEIQEFEAAQ